MGMGIVSPEEFNREKDNLIPSLDSPTGNIPFVDNPTNAFIVPLDNEPIKESGRRDNDVQVPESVRKLIGITSISEGRSAALSLAKELDISTSQVDAYSVGKTSSASDSVNQSLKSSLDKTKLRIRSKCKKRLYLALDALTEEKIASSKARDIAAIAKDMSSIMSNMEPKSDNPKEGKSDGPTFIFYKPELKNESEFGIVHSRE